jgi:hypothetical protein
MKKQIWMTTVAAILACAGLQGCGGSPEPSPDPSGTPTAADTATATHHGGVTVIVVKNPTRRQTRARPPSPSPTRKPTGECGPIVDGWWASGETVMTTWTTTPFPMVQFHVAGCDVLEFILVVYPAKAHLFEGDLVTRNAAIRDGSFSVSFDNPGGAGALSIFGDFPTGVTFRGSLMFSAGFQIGEYFLPETATIPFQAELALRDP